MRSKSYISVYLGLAFLGLLVLLHFLEPEFDPRWRMISEYELGRYGYLMSLAFFCWGGSYLFLSLSIWPSLNSPGGKIGKWWLMIIALACLGAGSCIPNQITEPIITSTQILHALSGVIVIFTTPIAALIISRSLLRQEKYKPFKLPLILFTALACLGFICFFASLIIYKPAGIAYNETTLIGFPNRFMVLTYTLWIIALSRMNARVGSLV